MISTMSQAGYTGCCWSCLGRTFFQQTTTRCLSGPHRASWSVATTWYAQSKRFRRTMRPRIVKLHGTFPSNPPFIFTGEDFRTYPRRFAAFVNLAQQAMMENVFCLLGFSGDDPNFLYWSGWVRDHLADSAPRIYLCGLMGLSDSQRRFLHRRNVTPIDLNPLFPAEEFSNGALRRRLAIEWFLLSLEAGRPPDLVSWPRSRPPLTPPSRGLPSIIGPGEPVPGDERLSPHG